MLKDLPFYEKAREANAKAHQDYLEQRENKRQEGKLRQAPSRNRTTITSTARLPTKKKSSTKTTKKTPVLVLASPSTSISFVPASATRTIPDSEADLDLLRVKPDIEFKPVVPHIIHEPEENKDMATNLKTGFRERQRKRLSESIVVTTPLPKKPWTEAPFEAPILDTLLVPKPSANVVGFSNVPPAKSPARKDTGSTQDWAPIDTTPVVEDLDEKEVAVPPYAPS